MSAKVGSIKEKLSFCQPSIEDYTNVTIVNIDNEQPLDDYLQAMKIADQHAQKQLDEFMMLSWYDKDRDFESPQHASECHMDSAVPGYVDYALYHGATLKIDFENGRFVFFYLAL
ncbi:MAG: AF1514 family protein [Pseudomonadota bacterium]